MATIPVLLTKIAFLMRVLKLVRHVIVLCLCAKRSLPGNLKLEMCLNKLYFAYFNFYLASISTPKCEV